MKPADEPAACPFYRRAREICCVQLDSRDEDEQRGVMSYCLSEEFARCPVYAEAAAALQGLDAVGRLPRPVAAGAPHGGPPTPATS